MDAADIVSLSHRPAAAGVRCWVERARQTYESTYSMHSGGSEESSLQDGTYHSMSSLTGSNGYPLPPHVSAQYLPHRSSASTMTSHKASCGPGGEEDDSGGSRNSSKDIG